MAQANVFKRAMRYGLGMVISLAVGVGMLGCSTANMALRNRQVGGTLAALAVTPNADIEQTYYLGSFDPQDQVPPAIYRIRVRGQSSILNQTRFASSWVPAEVVDALTGSISFKDKDSLAVQAGTVDPGKGLSVGRGMVMFGPEGFREAPRNHRLVIIMGSDPEQVEQAFSSALGTIASVKFGQSGADVDRTIFDLLLKLSEEKDSLRVLQQANQAGGRP